MIIKFYGLAWLVTIAAALAIHFTGNMNETTVPVLAFLISALFFAGVIAVLPWWLERQFAPKRADGGAR